MDPRTLQIMALMQGAAQQLTQANGMLLQQIADMGAAAEEAAKPATRKAKEPANG